MAEKINFPFKAEVLTGEDLPDGFGQGTLNIMQPLMLPGGERVFWRQPRTREEVAPVLEGLNLEYTQTGFMGRVGGGGYTLRTLTEQYVFANQCKQKGIKVAGVEFQEGVSIVRMILGQPLSKYLKNLDPDLGVVNTFLDSILRAHKKGVVLGDRWTKNALVEPNGDIVHIDFDIKLKGPDKKEFEMAQAMFYVSLANGDGSVNDILGQWLKDVLRKTNAYDIPRLEQYLKAHQKLAELYPQMKP